MATIKRKTLPRHFLVVDTNCLWHADKKHVVHPTFQEFWDAHTTKFDIRLVIPEVVKGEILFQQTTSTLRTLERVNQQFENISGSTGKNYKHRLTETRLRRDVQTRLDKWIGKVNGDVEPTPVVSIDWPALIQSAIWRKPPFTEDKETEKGFRDSLILETVASFCLHHPDAEIAFVCNDRLLREETTERLKSFDKLSVYENIQAFEAYLKLTLEQLTEDFVRDIQRKAKVKFFSSSNGGCLFSREDIVEAIRDKFQEKFANPTDGLGRGLNALLNPSPVGSKWESISNEKVWIYPPQFQSLENASSFHWKSNVVLVELYEQQGFGGGGLIASAMQTQRKLQILSFAILWKANVGRKGRFTQMELEDIIFEDRTFEDPASELLDNYGIKIKLVENDESESNKSPKPTQ